MQPLDLYRPASREVSAHARDGLLAPGSILQGYAIDSVIKDGSLSVVYKAYTPAGPVAIKEYFPKGLARRLPSGRISLTNPDNRPLFNSGLSTFANEGEALNSIRSDLLVQRVELFRELDTAYLVTRFEDGETLESFAKSHFRRHARIDEDELRFIFYTLLHGIHIMHQAGYVHLDLKPSNIIMRDANTPILIDLGAARQIKDVSFKRNTSYVSNYTPGFAAPEQYDSNADRIGIHTDIYAVGANIYYCMSRRQPQPAIDRMNSDALIPAIRAFGAHYSNQLLEIVDACMQLEPAKRYQDVIKLQRILSEPAPKKRPTAHRNEETT